ncbi:MAG: tRNA (adenosine(37)-N6)-threonylcarbamoyltransferase complex dimerization subunit type 1 TsaB [Alphaproteobacteria bacterium]|nr:tRNA (adenosine(37)-N6)-threonylcarbamoyltransferase complex dimerization subunit type 1 TsaB [Alphaproteobacteria bacterium]
MKIILGIDTTLDQCSVALLRGTECLSDSQQMQRGQAEILMPKIITLLRKADVSFSDLNMIAVTVGPGSFTSLRIGLATAKGLSLAAQIPIVGFKTFEVLAHSIPTSENNDSNLLVAIDSLRADIYCQLYNPQLIEIESATTLFPEDILNYTGFKNLRAIGNGIHALKEQLSQYHPHVIFPELGASPTSEVLCQMAMKLSPLDYQNSDLRACQPFYLRPPDVTLPR